MKVKIIYEPKVRHPNIVWCPHCGRSLTTATLGETRCPFYTLGFPTVGEKECEE